MIEIHPEILQKDNKNEFAILSYEEFQKLIDYIESLEDLMDLRKAKQAAINETTFSLEEVKKTLGL